MLKSAYKYYVAFLLTPLFAFSAKYSFPNTQIEIQSPKKLFTDQKTGGFTPQDRSFQFLAFEFEQSQPNNLTIRALKETWKKAGQKILAEKDVRIEGFWGQEIHTSQNIAGKTSFTRNIVFGDFNKVAQLSFVCAIKDPREVCKGSEAIIKSIKWKYNPQNSLKALSKPIKIPEPFKLYLKVSTKEGPVMMYTKNAEPLSDDSIPSLNFAINKGALDVKKFLMSFAGSSEMTNINPQNAGIKSKRTKEDFLYSWGQRPPASGNFYLSCGSIDQKKSLKFMVCGTASQSNYKEIHAAIYQLANQ